MHNAFEHPTNSDIMRRHAAAPRIYFIPMAARSMPSRSIRRRALEETAGKLTGVFGLAGLERGTGSKLGEPGWITVRWMDDPERKYCGQAAVGADWINLCPSTPGCRCSGGPAVSLSTVRHELGHALGFHHTESRNDLMYSQIRQCDQQPSTREQYHAALAYTQTPGGAAS